MIEAAPPVSEQLGVRKKLGDVLIERDVVTAQQLGEALDEQRRRGHRRLLGQILVELNFATSEEVMEALAECYGVPFARITPKIADPRIVEALPREFLESQTVLPLFLVDKTLTVAVSEPANLFLIEEIERLTHKRVQIVASTATDIRATLQAHLPSANVFVIDDIYEDVEIEDFTVVENTVTDLAELEAVAGQSPVVKLVNYLIYQGVQDKVSDIHIEPGDHACRVRFRIDGRLVARLSPPHQMQPAIVSRIKIMSGLDISERRLPQDGDIHVLMDGRPVDLRISTMPGKFGEKVVIRIIDKRSAIVSLEKIGLSPQILSGWRMAIESANGFVLVTGPTGSGKSTTLYSALNELSCDELNLSTVENPVEVSIPGVNQFQVNEKAGFTFASSLRALLRQDPDIIMVGEIRDQETATVATQAALTGHLIFSTLHTNDAVSAVPRLVNMGVESYLVAATLRAVLAQRLVRKICPHCKEVVEPDDLTRQMVEESTGACEKLYAGVGCSRCHGSGYAGRLGVFELFVPDDDVLEAIAKGATIQDLRTMVLRSGYRSMRDDGFAKASMGLTTVEEVVRVTAA